MTDHHDPPTPPAKLPDGGVFEPALPELGPLPSEVNLQVTRSQMRAYGSLLGQVSERVDDFIDPGVDVDAYIVGTLGFRPDEPPPRPDDYVYAGLSPAERALLNAHFAGNPIGDPPMATAIEDLTAQGAISYRQLRRFILKKVAA
jgi:hypothetical protein